MIYNGCWPGFLPRGFAILQWEMIPSAFMNLIKVTTLRVSTLYALISRIPYSRYIIQISTWPLKSKGTVFWSKYKPSSWSSRILSSRFEILKAGNGWLWLMSTLSAMFIVMTQLCCWYSRVKARSQFDLCARSSASPVTSTLSYTVRRSASRTWQLTSPILM